MSFNKNGNVTADDVISHGHKILPDTYQEIEYLQNTGTQYLNINLNETDDTAYELHLYNDTVSSNYLHGATQKNAMIYNGLYNQNSLEYNWLTISYTASQDVYMFQEVTGTSIRIIINNQVFDRSTGTSDANAICLFACNAGARVYTGMKLYYCRIKQGGKYVRDLVPCYRKSDSVAGMYDLVNNVFYTNSGSGTFNIGPSVANCVGLKTSSIYASKIVEY